MKYAFCILLFFVFLISCRQDVLQSEEAGETNTYLSNDTIPETRDSVNPEPVAAYTSSKGSPLTVRIYETKETFRFIMQMEYQFLKEKDTLRIPNFGILPHIIIQKGEDKQSCIVGFLDTKNQFKEYKLVTTRTGNLQVKVLKHYYTGRYRTVYPDTAKQ